MNFKGLTTIAVATFFAGTVAASEPVSTGVVVDNQTNEALCGAYNAAIDNMDQEGLNKALDDIMDRVGELRDAGNKDAWFHDVCPKGTTGAERNLSLNR